MLARESLRIRTSINDDNHRDIGLSCGLLGRILIEKGNLSNETKELFERSLTIHTQYDGLDGINRAASLENLGMYYYHLAATAQNVEIAIKYFCLAKSKDKETVRIYTKVYGVNSQDAMESIEKLSMILKALSRKWGKAFTL
jgi:hypothetical protein